MRQLTAREKLLPGYGITTARILYFLPDYLSILQVYVWQDLDLAPMFPLLEDFLKFWRQNLEGRLGRVDVSHSPLISDRERIRFPNVFTLQ